MTAKPEIDLSKRTITATFPKHEFEDKPFVLTRKKELPYEFAWRVAYFGTEKAGKRESGVDQLHGLASTYESAHTTMGFASAEIRKKHKLCCDLQLATEEIVRTDVPKGQGVGSHVRAKTVGDYRAKWEAKMKNGTVVAPAPAPAPNVAVTKAEAAKMTDDDMAREITRLRLENNALKAEIERLKGDTTTTVETMTVKQIAEHFGCDRTTVYVWMKTREFPQPCGFEGRAKLWSAEEVRAWEARE